MSSIDSFVWKNNGQKFLTALCNTRITESENLEHILY
jgi:hypothetical protein